MSNSANFTISVLGDKTNTTWAGEFSCKPLLSHRDELVRDSRKRELLGAVNPQFADPRALNQADVFAELFVRLTKAPSFWVESGNGLDLLDDNVVAAIYREVMRLEKEAFDAIKKQAETAKADLRKADGSI